MLLGTLGFSVDENFRCGATGFGGASGVEAAGVPDPLT